MEGAVNAAISKALKLDSIQGVIVCKNISFRDKIHILRTVVDISPIDTAAKKQHDKFLNTVARYAMDRNMVAHDLFMADESRTGVEFLVAKAKGKLQFPTIIWTVDDVEKKSEELLTAQKELKNFSKLFGRLDVVKALLQRLPQDNGSPIEALFQLGRQPLGDPPPPSSPDPFDQEINRSEEPQTPDTPRE